MRPDSTPDSPASPLPVSPVLDIIAQWQAQQPPFDDDALTPWFLGDTPVGLLLPELAERLRQDPLFSTPPGPQGSRLVLHKRLAGPRACSEALQGLAQALRDEGWISAWRDERYDGLDHWGRVLFAVERAAFRTLGLRSRAIHVNGYRADGHLWLARRAASKPVDPDKLDNLAAGGIASGESPRETLLRELQEEAGVPAGLARHALESGILHSQRIEADGVHDELLYCFDLLLPDDFVPANQDGEVATFECVSPLEAARRLPAMTGDAAAVSARWLRGSLGGGLG